MDIYCTLRWKVAGWQLHRHLPPSTVQRTLPSSSTGLETSAAPRPRFRISGRTQASEPHSLRLDHIGQAAHGVDQLSAHRLIDFDQRDRVLACGSAPEM